MTRRHGQVTTRQAVIGMGSAVVLVAAIVWLLGLLVPVGERLEPLDAPAKLEFSDGCPTGPFQEPVRVGAVALFECPRELDGLTVRYQGEVVRAVLRRGSRAWLHVNDDQYAALGPLPEHRTTLGGNSGVPVMVPVDAAERIELVGNHRTRGDVIEVIGTYRRADPLDAGGPAIQAEDLRVIVEGTRLHHPVDPLRTAVGGAMLVLALVVSFVARRARRL